jgi:hypothetical protein
MDQMGVIHHEKHEITLFQDLLAFLEGVSVRRNAIKHVLERISGPFHLPAHALIVFGRRLT